MTIKKTTLGFMATALLMGATACQANIEIINDSPYTIEVSGYYYAKNQGDYQVIKPYETAIFHDQLVVYFKFSDQEAITEEENYFFNRSTIWVANGVKVIRLKNMNEIFYYDENGTIINHLI